MKRYSLIVVLFFFVAAIASAAFARTLEEEKSAVRTYLQEIDAKIVKYRRQGNSAKVKQIQADKKKTLARWEKLKTELEDAQVAPASAPLPPTVEVQPIAAKRAGLFGRGWNTRLSGQYLYTGKGSLSGSVGLKGELITGRPTDNLQYRLGLGYFQGGGFGLKAVPIYVGGIYNMRQAWLRGAAVYLTGGINYVIYGNGKTSGGIGGDAAVGINTELGRFEIGYSSLASNSFYSRGTSLSISQSIVL